MLNEYEEYIKNRFEGVAEITAEDTCPIEVWRNIVALADQEGAAKVINDKLCPSYPVSYESPEMVRIEIYNSFAGEIPVIYAGSANDFEQLVTNIVHKGVRPENISRTGAAFITGKTVRFIILSAKPYSNVPASELGLDDELWAEKSMLVRRSHECTHFFTKKTYGISNNIIHDELMADFMGLYDAFGFYKAEWFLRFMGLIEGSGGRLVVYTEGLSDETTEMVKDVLTQASHKLEKWSQTDSFAEMSTCDRIKTMCMAGVSGIANWDL